MKLISRLLDLIYPPRCIFCRTVLKENDICRDCLYSLPYTVGEGIYQKFAFVDKCISPFYYKDRVREAIIRFKFSGAQSYSRRFGTFMADCAENNLDCGSIDMVSCIPLTRKRQRNRGYNQAELLAKEISARTGVPFAEALKKTRSNGVQSKIKDRKKRSANVIGVYAVPDPQLVKGKTVLLVDDVVTTGSTMSECARMLRKAGAACVYGITIARHED